MPGRRHRPQTLGGAVYLVVLAGTLAGVALAAAGGSRTGVAWMGVAVLAGAGARLVLPEHAAGMLGCRHKAIDVLWMTGLGVGLVAVALSLRAPLLPATGISP